MSSSRLLHTISDPGYKRRKITIARSVLYEPITSYSPKTGYGVVSADRERDCFAPLAMTGHIRKCSSTMRVMALVVALVLFLTLAGPLSAQPLHDEAKPEADPVRYAIVTLAEPNGRVLFYFEVKNAGKNTWAPGSVALTNVSNPMGASGQHGLNRSVLPNETVYWDFEVTAPRIAGVHVSVWQIMRGGTAISPRMTCYVIVVPTEAQALREKIQKLIDEFDREHSHEVEQLIRQIRDLIAREGKGLIERLFESRCGLASGMLMLAAVSFAVRRRGW